MYTKVFSMMDSRLLKFVVPIVLLSVLWAGCEGESRQEPDNFPPAPPVMTGVSHGDTYDSSVTIEVAPVSGVIFSATIDGSPFTLGGSYSVQGSHTLVVTATKVTNGMTALSTVEFEIDPGLPAPEISGISDGGVYSSARVIDVTPVTGVTHAATVDGEPFTLGTSYSTEGSHTLVIISTGATGDPVLTSTYNFTIDTVAPTPPVVTGVSEGEAYNSPVRINAVPVDGVSFSATINGESFALGDTYSTNSEATLVVTAHKNNGLTSTTRISFVYSYSIDAANMRVFGDSISFGLGASDPSLRYSTLLAAYLGLTEINTAISGATLTTQQYREDMFSHYVADLLSGDNSDYVLFFLGTNDENFIKDEPIVGDVYIQRLHTILDELIAYGYESSRIMLITPYYHAQPESAQIRVHDAITDAAQAYNTILIDFWTEVNSRVGRYPWAGGYLDDGIHPNDAGHQILFEIARDEIDAYNIIKSTEPEGLRDEADYANKVWIDASLGSNGDGSYLRPYSSFYGISVYNADTVYLLKRGTTETMPGAYHSEDFADVGISAWGAGEKPRLVKTDSGGALLGLGTDSEGALVKNLHIIGHCDTQWATLLRTSSDDVHIAYSNIQGDQAFPDNLPYSCLGGSGHNVMIHHNELSYCHNDGLSWGYGDSRNVKLTYNYIHHVAQASIASPGEATGDGVQFEKSHAGVGDFAGLYVANNWIDRSDTVWKFCFIVNAENSTGPMTIEYNTFIMPPDSQYGGAGVYFSQQQDWGSSVRNNIFLENEMTALWTWEGVVGDRVENNLSVGAGDMSSIAVDASNVSFATYSELQTYMDANWETQYGSKLSISYP